MDRGRVEGAVTEGQKGREGAGPLNAPVAGSNAFSRGAPRARLGAA